MNIDILRYSLTRARQTTMRLTDMRGIILLIALSIAAGCSNKGTYDAVQAGKQMECAHLPESDYEGCMREANRSYEDYDRDRKALLDDED